MNSASERPGLAPKRRRGIYLLPNLFTTATLFGGFYAIIAAVGGQFESAAFGILGAMIADGLDGRIARLTHTASEFGKEYDSLCDMVAFGLAAGLVMYAWSLHHLGEYEWLGGKMGWAVAFAYAACAALRLARFNVLASRGGTKGNFFGLPSPAAAAVTVGFVWAADARWGLTGEQMLIPAVIITAGAAALMVTNIRFASFKQVKLAKRVPFRNIAIALALFALFLVDPPNVFFLAFFLYALSGPVGALYRRIRKSPGTPPDGESPAP